MDLNDLIASENLHIQQLEKLVKDSIAEEETLSNKLVEIERDDQLSFSQKLADKVATFGGSWTFIITFGLFVVVWIGVNSVLSRDSQIDPFPFILLNLLLSCIAALQAPIIMMSQNRQEDKDRQRSRSDYLINLKAELEVRGLHRKVDLLIAEEMKTLFKIQQTQIEMLIQIQEKLQSIHLTNTK